MPKRNSHSNLEITFRNHIPVEDGGARKFVGFVAGLASALKGNSASNQDFNSVNFFLHRQRRGRQHRAIRAASELNDFLCKHYPGPGPEPLLDRGEKRSYGWPAGTVPAAWRNEFRGANRICTAAVTLLEAFG